ncbi:MAG TPA: outer membrane beta-barrel protein [Gemmatimonadaceae bacterium]|nr:outer membrane beta-barrel protein [Gemmatimonadaceae bacterium]
MSAKVSILAVACIAAQLVSAPRALAQEEHAHLGVDRLGSFLSWAWTDHAKHGREIGADLDIGSVFSPKLRLAVGLNYFHADIDRRDHLGDPVIGTFHDFSVHAEASYEIARIDRFGPYVGAGVGVHWRASHINDDIDNTARLYKGAVVGGDFFGGTTFALSKSRRFSLYAEARRVEAQNVERTLARLGLIVKFR